MKLFLLSQDRPRNSRNSRNQTLKPCKYSNMVQRQSPQNCTVLEHDLITSVFNPNQWYSHDIQAKKANSQLEKSHINIHCLDKGLLWPKVSFKHSYLDLEFSETSFLLQIWPKKHLDIPILTPENFVRYPKLVIFKAVSSPLRVKQLPSSVCRGKNPRHPRRASWSFRCKAS